MMMMNRMYGGDFIATLLPFILSLYETCLASGGPQVKDSARMLQ